MLCPGSPWEQPFEGEPRRSVPPSLGQTGAGCCPCQHLPAHVRGAAGSWGCQAAGGLLSAHQTPGRFLGGAGTARCLGAGALSWLSWGWHQCQAERSTWHPRGPVCFFPHLSSKWLWCLHWVCKTETRISAADFSRLFPAQPEESERPLLEPSSCPLSGAAFAVSRFSRGSQGFRSFFSRCLRLRSMLQYSINRLAWRTTKQENVIQIKVTLWLK